MILAVNPSNCLTFKKPEGQLGYGLNVSLRSLRVKDMISKN